MARMTAVFWNMHLLVLLLVPVAQQRSSPPAAAGSCCRVGRQETPPKRCMHLVRGLTICTSETMSANPVCRRMLHSVVVVCIAVSAVSYSYSYTYLSCVPNAQWWFTSISLQACECLRNGCRPLVAVWCGSFPHCSCSGQAWGVFGSWRHVFSSALLNCNERPTRCNFHCSVCSPWSLLIVFGHG